MSSADRTATRVLRLAQVSTIIAAVVAAMVIKRSWSGSSATAGPTATIDLALSDVADPPRHEGDLARIVARDPFSPIRKAPEVPYRLVAADEVPSQRASPVVVRLLGTVVRASGPSFALCQLANGPPRAVYPGQRVGTLVLESVGQGSAVFIGDNGERLTLRVPGPGR